MTEPQTTNRTPEELRTRAEMLVSISEQTGLPLVRDEDLELEAAIAQVQSEKKR